MFDDSDPIIEKNDVLKADNYVYQPESLPEREDELRDLQMALRPIKNGETPHNVLIHGPTGQGKTVGVDIKMNQLEEWAEETGHDVSVARVRCKGCSNSYNVLTLLIQELRELRTGEPAEEPAGYQKRRLVRMAFDEIDKIGGTVIIVLDEIDGMGDDTFALYELTRPELENAKIGVIGITNDTQFRDNLDSDVKSSLGKRTIHFSPYNANQLQNILARRAICGLHDTELVKNNGDGPETAFKRLKSDVISKGTIARIAKYSGSDTGDARDAIELLQHSCELAEKYQEDKVTADLVDEAYNCLERKEVMETVSGESEQRQLALAGVIKEDISGNDNPETNEVYRAYKAFCDHTDQRVLTKKSVRDKLNDLAHVNVLTKATRSRGKNKGVTNNYALAIDRELAIDALEESPLMAGVAETLRKHQENQ